MKNFKYLFNKNNKYERKLKRRGLIIFKTFIIVKFYN